jgi:hypothetical protein
MRDLHLWRLLQAPSLDTGAVVGLLHALAELPLLDRLAYLGLMPALGQHPDPAVRAAALGVLAGATGRLALQRLVLGLGDPDLAVRLAAVAALRTSVHGHDWARWVHALFHPDPDVRRAALSAGEVFPPPAFYKIFLLPDEACRSLVEEQLAHDQLDGQALPLLFDYLRRGLVPAAVARRLVRGMAWNDWLTFLGDLLPRQRDMSATLADAMQASWPSNLLGHYYPDRLDDMLLLMWEPDLPEQLESAHRAFFDLLWDAALAEAPPFQQWLAFTLLGVAVQKQSWPAAAAELCAVLYPPFLACPWVALDVRRAALAGLYRAGSRCPKWPADPLRSLVEGEVCQVAEQSEQLDLWAAAALLHAVDGSPCQTLLDWLGLQRVITAFQADLERGMPLLALPDPSPRARTYLIRELCLRASPGLTPGENRNRMLALLAQAAPADQLDFLDSLDGSNACGVLAALLDLEADPPPPGKSRPLSDNKVDRLARLLARKVAAGQVGRFLDVWLAQAQPQGSALAAAILSRLVHDHQTGQLVPALARLSVERVLRFLDVIPFCAGFPYDEEVDLARRLQTHSEAAVRSWAVARLHQHEQVLAGRDEDAEPPQGAPVLRLGLCAALEARPDPVEPSVETCQALLASQDPPGRVVGQLVRFLSAEPAFLTQLDVEMVRHWRGEDRLPFLGHTWLWRWDSHLRALAVQFLPTSDEPLPFADRSLAGALRWALGVEVPALATRTWEAARTLLEYWRWHDRARLEACWTTGLADVLVDALPAGHGEQAARIVLHWRDHARASPLLDQLRQRLVAVMPRLPEAIRQLFHPWIDTRGLESPPQELRPPLPAVAESDDLDHLQSTLRGPDEAVACAAARRLRQLGEPGCHRLAGALGETTARWPLVLVEDLTWQHSPALCSAMSELVANPRGLPEVRFRLGQALWPVLDRDQLLDLIDAACQPSAPGWFTRDDFDWIAARASKHQLSPLPRSPHPLAHGPAVEALTAGETEAEQLDTVRQALLDFLDAGTQRMRVWRIHAAEWLYRHGEGAVVLPLLLSVDPKSEPPYPALLAGVDRSLVQAVTAGVLMAGLGETSEEMLLALLQHNPLFRPPQASLASARVDPMARQEALGQLLSSASSANVRQRARRALRPGIGRSHKLRRVADTFAWGVRIGRQLTGKLFTLEMIAGEDLGYTRLRENKLYITPMPLLRGQQNAREVVRALILHEYGHHLYHKGDEAERTWEQSEEERLQGLLNLVSDEHLERNLRARDGTFGDQLKMLAAYAFQHTAREVSVETLLNVLRGQSFAVLSSTHLGVARKHGCVVVHSGKVLLHMERAGLSFARFLRALRMGLGNRHDDAKVAQALELFRGNPFRASTMPQMLEIARKLRTIFGDETDLLETFNQDAALLGEAEDLADASEGITNEELQAEVRRTLEGQTGRPRGDSSRSGGRGYNVDPSEEFDQITNVVPKIHDPVRHGEYAQRVARQAERMRRYLRQLGLGYLPQRLRVRGRSFDRTRARAVVLRGDPRMLIAREMFHKTDLFLGVLIDCSGSMSSDNNIEKAKLFGTLLAEAARGNQGIDLRLWGFTDRTIYDCGNAARPAVHDLSPEDGNNDAAALWHAALAARASKRRAKLLVMISDGSPTGCSVAALTALVQRLTRRMKLLCAQVAVRPLDDVCFPHHVLLEDDSSEESVKRFGTIVMKLVRQALGS